MKLCNRKMSFSTASADLIAAKEQSAQADPAAKQNPARRGLPRAARAKTPGAGSTTSRQTVSTAESGAAFALPSPALVQSAQHLSLRDRSVSPLKATPTTASSNSRGVGQGSVLSRSRSLGARDSLVNHERGEDSGACKADWTHPYGLAMSSHAWDAQHREVPFSELFNWHMQV